MPPIVGVPFFLACDIGPSSLMDSPISLPSNRLINLGPKRNEITKAVKALKIPRVVIYVNALNAEKISIN
jgi:hypothetical protein